MSRSYHLHVTLLPDGDVARDLWVVGGHLTFAPVDDAEELTSTAAYALPGLVDAHSHLTIDNAGRSLPAGSAELVTANRDAQLAAGVLLLRDVGGVNDAALGLPDELDGRPLPRVSAAGRFLAPAGGYMGFQQQTTAEELPEAAAAQVAAGAEWVKIVGDFPRTFGVGGAPLWNKGELNYPADAIRRAVEAVHAAGGRVAVHALTRSAIVAALDAGVDSLEHGAEVDAGLLKQMADAGTAWTPTLGVFQAIVAGSDAVGSPEFTAWCHDTTDRAIENLRSARALNVTVMAGTDFLPAGAIAYEVAALQKLGDPPARALAAASTDARRFLRYPGLEEGAAADLILYNTDPRRDPEALAKPAVIMLGGEIVRRSAA